METLEENTSVWTAVDTVENASSLPSNESQWAYGGPTADLTDLVFNCVNTLVSLVGNALSLAVFLRGRLRGTPSSGYLAALAVADMGSAVVYLLYVNQYRFAFLQKTYFCKITGYLFVVFPFLSAWFVVCFTVERYISVCHPLRAPRLFSRLPQRYVVALVTLLPAALYSGLLIPGEFACQFPDIPGFMVYTEALVTMRFLTLFAIPSPLIAVLNLLIVCRLRQHSRSSNLGTRVQEERRAQNTSITRTLLLVSLLFFVCNFPYTVYFLVYRASWKYYNVWVDSVFTMLYCVSFSGNFFVYALSGTRFRTSLKNLLTIGCTSVHCTCRQREEQQEGNGEFHMTSRTEQRCASTGKGQAHLMVLY